MEKKLIIIDGNSLMNRAFYGLPPMKSTKGISTNVVYGFINMLTKLHEDYQPSHIVIAFDRKAPTFRHIEYDKYKANRSGMPEELAEQVPFLKMAIEALDFEMIEMDGFEADDIIGTISKHSNAKGMETLVITADKDALQLITENVNVLLTKKGISEIDRVDLARLHEMYGILPFQIIEMKALMGDASDNIPGVPGVGEKTALELIKTYNNIENLYEKLDEIKKPKLKENLENNKESAFLSKRLATIYTDMEISIDYDAYNGEKPDYNALEKLYSELSLKGFLIKIKKTMSELGISSTSNSVETGFTNSLTQDLVDDALDVFEISTDSSKENANVTISKNNEGNISNSIPNPVDLVSYTCGINKENYCLGNEKNQLNVELNEINKIPRTEEYLTEKDSQSEEIDQISFFDVGWTVKKSEENENFEEHIEGNQKSEVGIIETSELYKEVLDIEKIFPMVKSVTEKMTLNELSNYSSNTPITCKTITLKEMDYLLFEYKDEVYYSKIDNSRHGDICSDASSDCNNANSSEGFVDGFLANDKIIKTGYDFKTDLVFLGNRNISVKNFDFDLMIAAYLVNPLRNFMKPEYLVEEFLEEHLSEDLSWNEKIYQIVLNGKRIREKLNGELKLRDIENLLYEIELPLSYILADMEIRGFKIDENILGEIGNKLGTRIDELVSKIHNAAGTIFNINSPKQLADILFVKLELPSVKKTKTGFSTDVEVLEELKDKHEIIEYLLEYRQLVKLKGTYVDGLLPIIKAGNGKVHSKLNQGVAATGRLSSTDPNLQNIPIKTETGREIRKAFVPEKEGNVLVIADYSQIELRILAHISKDENLIRAFIEGEDIHTHTAAEVFGIKDEEVTSIQRSRAKAVNFGIVYGISPFGLSRDLGISTKEAKTYIDLYFEKYPKVKDYMKNIVIFARETGYVTTIMGRRRNIPEITSRNAVQRGFGERIAMNTPIQGSAADIIKKAMIDVYKALKAKKLKARMIMQVHDELIIDTPIQEIDEVKKILKNSMEDAVKLSVPLTVDIGYGKSWFDAK